MMFRPFLRFRHQVAGSVRVHHYHPLERVIKLGAFIIALILCSVIAYWFGVNGYEIGIPYYELETADIQRKANLVERRNRQLEREVALLKRSAKVELASVDEMKNDLHAKDLQMHELKEELKFYKTLFKSENEGVGLQVKRFKLHKENIADNEYVYDFVLAQTDHTSNGTTSGVVGVLVDGEQQGISKRLVFKDAERIDEDSMRFSFKYFQELKGSFVLPQDFIPNGVLLQLVLDKDPNDPVVVNYTWQQLMAEG